LPAPCPPGRQALNKRACGSLILWHIIIRHCLRVTLIQVKLAVDFLLLHAELAQAFFMLEGAVKLLPVIRERLFHALTPGFLFLGVAVKAAECILNAGDSA
jgi:hypothetical protein